MKSPARGFDYHRAWPPGGGVISQTLLALQVSNADVFQNVILVPPKLKLPMLPMVI